MLFIILSTAIVGSAMDLSALTARIERAVVAADTTLLENAARELEELPPSTEARYTLAYVHWRLSYAVGPDRKDEHAKHLEQARAILEDLVEASPDDAEAHALLGAVIGGQISNPFKGMVLGPKSTRALDRAHDLAPDNPRVLFHQGVSAVFTPGMFGGGLDRAESKLREAQALFASQPPRASWPSWGRVDVQAWLGVVLHKQGDVAGARAALENGLAMEPDHAWIRNVLLPQLDAN